MKGGNNDLAEEIMV